MCAADGAPVEAGGHTYEVGKTGMLVHGDLPGRDWVDRSAPRASADTLVGLGLDERMTNFSERPSDCWAREIAHEALHAVFPDHSHKNITGDDGLEKCITCGGRL